VDNMTWNPKLLRRVTIEYWLDEVPEDTKEGFESTQSKLLDCGREATFERVANDYCPKGVHVVTRGG